MKPKSEHCASTRRSSIKTSTANDKKSPARTKFKIQNSKFKIRKTNSFTVSFKLAEYDKSKELVIDPILAYGSYLGGSVFDEGRAIAVDADGNAYIVGTAASRDFPTTAGTIKPVMLPRQDAPNSYWYDAFVTKVNPTGTAIVYSTYFGGRNGNETGSGVAVDASGNALISGTTMSPDFPLVNAYQLDLQQHRHAFRRQIKFDRLGDYLFDLSWHEHTAPAAKSRSIRRPARRFLPELLRLAEFSDHARRI